MNQGPFQKTTSGQYVSVMKKDGVNGRDGTDGLPGKDGADGAPGQDGIDGKNGADGHDGVNGIDGKSAYEIAVANGFIGTESEVCIWQTE